MTNATTQTDLRRFIELLYEPEDVFEVRAPKCLERRGSSYTSTVSGYFTVETLDRAVAAIAELDESALAPGVYITLNPVRPDLLARAANRLRPRAAETTADGDLLRRRWMLIDVDPVRPSGVSASDAELARSLERAEAVRDHLAAQDWPAPALAMSGNGHHLLCRVDLPGNDGGLVRRVLEALSARLSDDSVSIDRSVFNPARIVKAIGTAARKGDDLRGATGIDDRPHRRSHLIEVPDPIGVVTHEQLEAIAAAAPSEPAPTRSIAPPATNGRFPTTPAGVRAWLEARGVAVKGERRNGDKTMLLLDRCPVDPEIVSTGGSDIAVLVGGDGMLAYCNKHSRGQGYTWHDLRRAVDPEYVERTAGDSDVDLSGIVSAQARSSPGSAAPPAPEDPGPLPEEMLRVPGFVGEVMDFCLETAPYPNLVMAFCGALALQAFLAGRKVRDCGDNRTNIYLLGLAHSAAGKDWPRKLNTRIVHDVGLAGSLGERFASGEGIQDALFQTPSMLFQTDEIDGMLQSINKARDARHEPIMSTLLTMYSSANSVYPMRRKAGKESPGVIDQPGLVIFGTAIPNHYYEALSERMLTNGFFARMVILEAGPRSPGQEPIVRDPPPRILETAKWWSDFRPGPGNLEDWHPVPAVVEYTDEARRVLVETRERAEVEYAAAEARSDAVGTTVWGRVSEQARKLALLHAVSEDHRSPRIGLDAARWASEFVMHQTRRMLFMASQHVAENPFHAECLKVIEKLRSAPGRELTHSVLLKRMKMDAKSFGVLIDTLTQQDEIEVISTARPGWHLRSYRLVGAEVKLRGETSSGGET